MLRYAAAWLGAGLLLAGLDAVWLTTTNTTLYRPLLGEVLAASPRLGPAILFYVIYLVGVVVFAVTPAMRSGRWRDATILGALLGFFCYATYDLTNQATLVVWATKITVLDLCWGTFLTASGATAGYFASKLVPRS
ncbi:MAG: hypothetical protein JWO83_646 [Caulobacteraceae bacterium]|jgi:uncharacterized membrane protein|nr:hypothetical protein [Caulobacteraceae bacterium]